MLLVYRLRIASTVGNFDPRILSAIGSFDGIPSMGSPVSVLSIDSVHGSLSVRFVNWLYT